MSNPHRINPSVTKIAKRQWRLNAPFLGVPAGFISDGASVPRLLWAFLDPAGEAFEAAIVHDYQITIDKTKYKTDAHRAFRNIMLGYGVTTWKAYVAYYAVYAYWLVKGFTNASKIN